MQYYQPAPTFIFDGHTNWPQFKPAIRVTARTWAKIEDVKVEEIPREKGHDGGQERAHQKKISKEKRRLAFKWVKVEAPPRWFSKEGGFKRNPTLSPFERGHARNFSPKQVGEILRHNAKQGSKMRSWIWIAGVRCPKIGKNWMPYMRRKDESPEDWQRRVRGMVQARKLGREIRREEAFHSLSLDEKIERFLVQTGEVNRFDCLHEERDEPFWDEPEGLITQWRVRRRKLVGPKNLSLKGRQVLAFIERQLERKQKLAELHDEWREARFLRREKARSLRTEMPLSLEGAREVEKVVGQSDPPKEVDSQGSNDKPKIEKKSNVVLEDSRGASVANPIPPSSISDFVCMSCDKTKVSAKTLSDRWITIYNGKWQKSDTFGKVLKNFSLPFDVIQDTNLQNSPNLAMFMQNTYWRGDMVVKVVINSNARQYGQLQCSFYYGFDQDANRSLRNYAYIASQQPHCLVTANFSNSGELRIPYQYIYPLMNIKKPLKETCSIGQFRIIVLVPLNMVSTTQTSCTYSVMISFENNYFAGMISRGLHGQMFSVARAALDVLDPGDSNRDNPPAQMVGTPVYPQNVGSWCAGGGTSQWTNTLRLFPNKFLPSFKRGSGVNEMLVDSIKQVYGLIDVINWSDQDNSKKLLTSFDAAPLFEMTKYKKISDIGEDTRCLPPVAVLSTLFAYWRGDLELRIDVVGCVELTGRLQVSYIPRQYTDPGMDLAVQCISTIFDLQSDKRQFIFTIPFLSDKPVWPTRFGYGNDNYYDDVKAPGTVFIYVFNDLIHNSTIPGECQLLLYLRGGKNFELTVPVMPTIALGFNRNIIYNQSTEYIISFKEGYSPSYIDTWRGMSINLDGFPYPYACAVARYGAVTDHVVQLRFSGFKVDLLDKPLKNNPTHCVGEIPIVPLKSGLGYKTKIIDTQDGNKEKDYVFTTFIIVPSAENFTNSDYFYLVPLVGDSATITNIVLDPKLKIHFNLWDEQAVMHVTGENRDLIYRIVCLRNDYESSGYRYKLAKTSPGWTLDFQMKFYQKVEVQERVVGQMDDERKTNKTVAEKPSMGACASNFGDKIFGENFGDLKDYCRRFQLYATGYIPGINYANTRQNSFLTLKFPVLPQGLDLDLKNTQDINEANNRLRDGPIPIIASGFRFFYGGVRFRILVEPMIENNLVAPFKLYVTHRPNKMSSKFGVSWVQCSDLNTDDLEQNGYAFHIQMSETNRVLEIEVPYYSMMEKAFLQRPIDKIDVQTASCLGELALGINVTSMVVLQGIKYEIYYCLADDARFSLFQGFPPVMNITDLTAFDVKPVNTVHKEEQKRELIWKDMQLLPMIPEADPRENEVVTGQMFSILSRSSRAIDQVNQIDTNSINEAFNSVRETSNSLGNVTTSLNDVISSIKDIFTNIKDKFSFMQDIDYDKVVSLFINFAQIVVNPSPATIALSVANFLLTIKVISTDLISKFIDLLKRIIERYFKSRQETSIETNEEEVIGNSDDDVRNQYLSLLFTGVSSLVGVTRDVYNLFMKKAPLSKFANDLFKTITESAKQGNIIITFIKNHLNVIDSMIEWWYGTQPDVKNIMWLEEHGEEVFNWAKDCMVLTDSRMEPKIFSSMHEAQKVYQRATQANCIQLRLADVRLENSQMLMLSNLSKNIISLRDKLGKQHITPQVKFEPFVLCIWGPSNVGKSHLAQNLVFDMLDSIKYRTYGEVIYTRQAGNSYWNGLTNQPVVLYDDFLAVEDPNFSGVQLAELFQLKTRAVFNPPMAAVEDKHLRYNPLIVVLLMNNAFPKLTGVLDEKAVYRRRSVLLQTQMKTEFVGKDPEFEIDQDVLSEYGHLEFFKAESPVDSHTAYSQYGDYGDFHEKIIEQFKNYYVREEKRYRASLTKLTSLYPGEDELEHVFASGEHNYESLMGELNVKYEDLIFNRNMNENNRKLDNPFRRSADYIKNIYDNINQYISTGFRAEPQALGFRHTYEPGSSKYAKFSQTLWALTGIEYTREAQTEEDVTFFVTEEEQSVWEALNPSERTTRDEARRCCHWILRQAIRLHPEDVDFQKDRDYWCINYHTHAGRHVPGISDPDAHEVYEKIFDTLTQDEFQMCGVMQEVIIEPGTHHCYIKNGRCKAGYCCYPAVRIQCFSEHIRNDPFHRAQLEMQNFTTLEQFYSAEILRELNLNNMIRRPLLELEAEDKLKWLKDGVNWIWTSLKKACYSNFAHYVKRVLQIGSVFFGLFALYTGVEVGVDYLMGRVLHGHWDSAIRQNSRMLEWRFQQPDFESWPVRERYSRFWDYNDQFYDNSARPNASGDSRVRGVRSRLPRVRTAGPVRGQMGSQDLEIFVRKIKRNTIFLKVFYEENSKYIYFRCIGICGKYMLTVKHSWEATEKIHLEVEENPVIVVTTIINDHNAMEFNFNEFEPLTIPNSSLILIKMPNNFPNFKDIRNVFCKEEAQTKVSGYGQIFETLDCEQELQLNVFNLPFWREDQVEVGGQSLYDAFEVPTSYAYEWGGTGKCGSLLVCPSLSSPVIGMHVAGVPSGRRGYSEIVSWEMFKDLDGNFSPKDNLKVAQSGNPKLIVPGQMYPLGRVSGALAHKVSTKSRIRPSLIQENYPFPIRKEVAHLKPCEETGFLSPLREGVMHHGDPMLPLPGDYIDLAYEDFNSKILAENKPARLNVGKLDEVTACRGFDGVQNYDPLEWDTSEGFPLINFRPAGVKNKRWLFEFDDKGQCIGLHKMLKDQINNDNELRLNKIIPDTIFTDCLKDQIIKPGKLTRVFSMAPIQLTVVQRQLTLDFVASFMRNRLDLEHMIGCNPDSFEWGEMTRNLLKVGNNIISIDFSKYGDKLPSNLILLAFKIIKNWNRKYGKFSEEDFTILDSISHEISNSKHLCLDWVYLMLGGQPSGNSLTVILNSLVFALMIRVAWLEIMADTKFAGLKSFSKEVVYYSFGDDGIISVSDEIKEYFNGSSLHFFFAKYNLNMTNSSKSKDIIPYTTLAEAEFLKRGFLDHPNPIYRRRGIILAPLSVESIEETPAWIWDDGFELTINDKRYVNICKQVSEDACRNAFTRGPEYYNWFVNKLKETWAKFNIHFSVDDWNSLNKKVYDLEETLIPYIKSRTLNP